MLGFDPEQTFVVADEVLEHTREALERGKAAARRVEEAVRRLGGGEPGAQGAVRPVPDRRAARWRRGGAAGVRGRQGRVDPRRIRKGAQRARRPCIPELWGGSADLAESNLTTIEDANRSSRRVHSTHEWAGNRYGRVLHFGIREHAMAAIVNGIVLHGKTRAFGGTFLIFSDYMRPAVRLAALMKVPSIYVWTHDSVALGEDGPTHQPIEQLAALRAIPGFDMVRPATRTRSPGPGRRSCERRAARRASRSPARTSRCSLAATARPAATRSPRRRTSPRARTCSPRRRTAPPT